MAKKTDIHCSVITPEEQVLETTADQVIIPAHDGKIGILNMRAPLLCELGQGTLRIDTTEAGQKSVEISGGFAQVLHNEVIILTETASLS
ncbi:MAG: F0F1 ATP synthase subunit epsilon [Phycisphaerae bacterium]